MKMIPFRTEITENPINFRASIFQSIAVAINHTLAMIPTVNDIAGHLLHNAGIPEDRFIVSIREGLHVSFDFIKKYLQVICIFILGDSDILDPFVDF